jgi:hypothetical protein
MSEALPFPAAYRPASMRSRTSEPGIGREC